MLLLGTRLVWIRSASRTEAILDDRVVVHVRVDRDGGARSRERRKERAGMPTVPSVRVALPSHATNLTRKATEYGIVPMCPGTSDVHHEDMENYTDTRQLIIDLRQAREAEACRRRLAKGDAEPVTCPAQPDRRHHHVLGFGRHSLARG